MTTLSKESLLKLVDAYVNSEFQEQHAMENSSMEDFAAAIKDKQAAHAALSTALDEVFADRDALLKQLKELKGSKDD